MDTRPLIITENLELLEDLLRVAAAAGVEILHASSPQAKMAWRNASLVILDAAKVRAAVIAGMPRRTGVLVVAEHEPSSEIWEQCVLLGVDRTLVLPAGEETLVAMMADATENGPGNGLLIATIGARGGAGSSVLAAALATAGINRGTDVLLADCDPWGAGLDLLFGLESHDGLRWSDLAAPGGRLPADALHEALPAVAPPSRRETSRVLSVLSFRREKAQEVTPDALDVVLDSCRRAGDLTIVDLPRIPYPAADLAVERADLVALVVPADVPSCYAGRRLVQRLADLGSEIGLVVRGPAPGGLGADDVAAALDLPLICQMRPQAGLSRDLELGNPPGFDRRGPLARASRSILDHVTATSRFAA